MNKYDFLSTQIVFNQIPEFILRTRFASRQISAEVSSSVNAVNCSQLLLLSLGWLKFRDSKKRCKSPYGFVVDSGCKRIVGDASAMTTNYPE